MSVQEHVRTVTVPSPAAPADPLLAPASTAPPATTGVPGRDRPLTSEEREFVLSLAVVFGGLATIIVTFLLLAQHVW